jgi:uncharacterized surface protein with fasciclin (FAS1) repeats
MTKLAFAVCLVAFCLVSGCKSAETVAGQSSALIELAEGIPEVSKFVDLAKVGGLAAMLAGGGQYTLLAPDNEAVESLGSDVLDRLKSPDGAGELKALLERHLVQGAIPANLLGDKLGPANALLTRENDAGLVHVIDSVLP